MTKHLLGLHAACFAGETVHDELIKLHSDSGAISGDKSCDCDYASGTSDKQAYM